MCEIEDRKVFRTRGAQANGGDWDHLKVEILCNQKLGHEFSEKGILLALFSLLSSLFNYSCQSNLLSSKSIYNSVIWHSPLHLEEDVQRENKRCCGTLNRGPLLLSVSINSSIIK